MKRSAPASTDEPPSKRAHISHTTASTSPPAASQVQQRAKASIARLSDELFLHILAYLPSPSLAAAQQVSHDWYRLARDNQLWKALFLRDHSPAHLRSVSHSGQGRRRAHDPFRPLAALPSRARPPPTTTASSATHQADVDLDLTEPARTRDGEREEGPLDWRWIYRLSQNWSTGFCRVSSFPLPSSLSSSSSSSSSESAATPAGATHLLRPPDSGKALPFAPSRLQLLGPYILLSSSRRAEVRVLLPSSDRESRILGTVRAFEGSDFSAGGLTCLAIDQQPPTGGAGKGRFAAFSARGSISIWSLPLPPLPALPSSSASSAGAEVLGARRTHLYTPPGGVARPIRVAAFAGELLVTLSTNFTLQVWHVPPQPVGDEESGQLRLLHSLYSFTNFPPAALSITLPPPSSASASASQPTPAPGGSARPKSSQAKITLHHLLPAYPSHWVPSSHQFTLSLPPPLPTGARAREDLQERGKAEYEIKASQSWNVAGWLPSPYGQERESSEDDSFVPSARAVGSGSGSGRGQGVRKLASVGALGGDGRNVLVVGDGLLHVYKLRPSSPHLRPSTSFPLPFPAQGGRAGMLKATALATDPHSGRCVVAMEDGGVAVFDLDGRGEGVRLPLPFEDGVDGADGVDSADVGPEKAGQVGEKKGRVEEVRFDEGRVVGLWRSVAPLPGDIDTSLGSERADEEERLVVWDFDC